MNFIKKWLGCIVSFISGVCGLALSACPGMVMSMKMNVPGVAAENVNETTKAFKIITDGDLYTQAKELGLKTEFVWMKIFAIAILVISIILILYSIVLLLKNLNVIHASDKVFDIITIVLIALFLVITIGLMISSSVYAGSLNDVMLDTLKLSGIPMEYIKLSIKVGAYQIAMLIISIIAFIATSVVTFLNRKEA